MEFTHNSLITQNNNEITAFIYNDLEKLFIDFRTCAINLFILSNWFLKLSVKTYDKVFYMQKSLCLCLLFGLDFLV